MRASAMPKNSRERLPFQALFPLTAHITVKTCVAQIMSSSDQFLASRSIISSRSSLTGRSRGGFCIVSHLIPIISPDSELEKAYAEPDEEEHQKARCSVFTSIMLVVIAAHGHVYDAERGGSREAPLAVIQSRADYAYD